MPLGLWLPLLGVFIVLGTVLGQAWLVFFATAVVILLGLAYYWRRHALDQVHYRRKWVYTRGFPGETTTMSLEVENRKRLPLSWLRVTDNWPAAVPPVDRTVLAYSHHVDRNLLTNLFSLAGWQKVNRQIELRFERRGIYPVGPVEIESGDLFGLFEESRIEDQPDTLTVFPEILPLSALNLPAEDPFGDRNAPRRLFEDPNRTVGVRGYRPEDEIRRIHWPATARTGELQVRVYQPVSARVIVVGLNVSTSESTWQLAPGEALEQLVKLSATAAYHAAEMGYSVGLISNGSLGRADHSFRILPARGTHHTATLLQALAGVTPIAIGPFEPFLLKTMPHIPMGATLLIVTAYVGSTMAETLTALQKYRAHTTLLSIAPQAPPDIPGVHTVHMPFIN